MVAQYEAINKFINAMADQGLTCKDRIIPDGKFHAFPTEGDKGSERSGRYFFHLNGETSGGYFGCWRRGDWHPWSLKDRSKMTPEERRGFNEVIARAKAEQEEERRRLQREARIEAKRIWDRAGPADSNHPYLTDKSLPAVEGIRTSGNVLITPLRDPEGKIHSLQRIAPDGSKKFLYNGAVTGHYHTIGHYLADQPIYICEGVATALAVHVATEQYTVITYNAGNLEPVARSIREQYPSADIVICGDDDQFNKTNAGREYADKAALAVNGRAVFPTFNDLSTQPTDFADLHLLEGKDAVREQITGAPEYGEPYFSMDNLRITEFLETPAKPMEYVIEGVMPTGKTGLLVAPGGTGKSMLLLQLSISVATGLPFLGRYEISKPGGVLAFFAEDDKDELHRRFENAVKIICESQDIDEQRFKLDLEKNLFMASLVGLDNIALTESTPAGPARTTAFNRFMATAKQIPQLSLIIFDPTSHFMGGDFNVALDATRYIQALQAFTQETGAFVLAVQHTNKTSMRSGTGMDQSAALGSVQLTNTSRWQMNMATMDSKTARDYGIQDDRERKQYVQADIPKTNYAPAFGQIWLKRGVGGYLHYVELSSREKAEIDRLVNAIVAKLKGCGGQYSREAFALEFSGKEGLGPGRDTLKRLIDTAKERGLVYEGDPVERKPNVRTALYAK